MTPLLTERCRDRLRGVLSFLLSQGAGNRQKRDHVDEPPISIAAASVIAEQDLRHVRSILDNQLDRLIGSPRFHY
jgi:hypothetical protein